MNGKRFEIAGLVSRGPASREAVSKELGGLPQFSDYYEALSQTRPDVVSINTYPETHGPYAKAAIEAGCHVFCEKPLAMTVEEAQAIVDAATASKRKLVIGYILRVHPAWIKFIEIARTLGKPLVMRMNLNQQSHGPAWNWHRNLMDSMSPIVDCGVHYVDVMCQMTGAKPDLLEGHELAFDASESTVDVGDLRFGGRHGEAATNSPPDSANQVIGGAAHLDPAARRGLTSESYRGRSQSMTR